MSDDLKNDKKNTDNQAQFENKKGLLFDPSQIAGAVSKEIKKRKREIIIVFVLSVIFVFLTWFEIRLFSSF